MLMNLYALLMKAFTINYLYKTLKAKHELLIGKFRAALAVVFCIGKIAFAGTGTIEPRLDQCFNAHLAK